MTRLIVVFGLAFWMAACAGPANTGANGQTDVNGVNQPQLPAIERAPWKMHTAMEEEKAYEILATHYQQDFDELRVIGISDGERHRQVVFFALDVVALWEEQAGDQVVEALWHNIGDALAKCEDIDTSMCDEVEIVAQCPQERLYQNCVMAAFPNPALYIAYHCGAASDLVAVVIEDGRITTTEVLVSGECDLFFEPERLAVSDIDGDGAVEFLVQASSASMVLRGETFLFLVVDAESLEVQFKDAVLSAYNYGVTLQTFVKMRPREDGFNDLEVVQLHHEDYCDLEAWTVSDISEECRVSFEHRLMRYIPSRDVWEYDSQASSE